MNADASNDAAAMQPRLPPGVRSRQIEGVNGLNMRCLEAGHEMPERPLVLLLHGFPDLAFAWRHQLPMLAEAGYHAVAPDMRGYGGTTGWQAQPGDDPSSFRMLNVATDVLALARRLGHAEVAAVIGHDFGSPVAAWCALARPDVFRRLIMMAAPFGGPPALPGPTGAASGPGMAAVLAELAALERPRVHYQWYFSRPTSAAELGAPPQGLHDFLRAYFHYKSADFGHGQEAGLSGRGAAVDEVLRAEAQVAPHALPGLSAAALARLPRYYMPDLGQDMPASVAPATPGAEFIARCAWLPDADLAVYVRAFERTGFQGGLQWYRCRTDPRHMSEWQLYAGRRIEVPALFIGGRQDWCVHMSPGAFEAMQTRACADLRGVHLIDGAGHWLQQERPVEVNGLIRDFLAAKAR